MDQVRAARDKSGRQSEDRPSVGPAWALLCVGDPSRGTGCGLTPAMCHDLAHCSSHGARSPSGRISRVLRRVIRTRRAAHLRIAQARCAPRIACRAAQTQRMPLGCRARARCAHARRARMHTRRPRANDALRQDLRARARAHRPQGARRRWKPMPCGWRTGASGRRSGRCATRSSTSPASSASSGRAGGGASRALSQCVSLGPSDYVALLDWRS